MKIFFSVVIILLIFLTGCANKKEDTIVLKSEDLET